MEYRLDEDLRSLEAQLRSLTPKSLSDPALQRMEKIMEQSGDLPLLDSESATESMMDLTDVEMCLSQMAPAALSNDVLTRMTRAMDNWQDTSAQTQETESDNVLQLTQKSRPARRGSSRGMFAAAAAVALMGAIAALTLPSLQKNSSSSVTAQQTPDGHGQASGAVLSDSPVDPNAWMASDGLSHKVTNTSEKGIILSRDNTPHRCIRVDSMEKLKVKDSNGREIEIMRPTVNYMLIPVETN